MAHCPKPGVEFEIEINVIVSGRLSQVDTRPYTVCIKYELWRPPTPSCFSTSSWSPCMPQPAQVCRSALHSQLRGSQWLTSYVILAFHVLVFKSNHFGSLRSHYEVLLRMGHDGSELATSYHALTIYSNCFGKANEISSARLREVTLKVHLWSKVAKELDDTMITNRQPSQP